MQSLTQPTLLLKPFCQDGDKNQIPVQNDSLVDPQLADLTNGFPEITSRPPSQGGLPPERRDFNALGYLTTSYDWFYQAGGTFTFNPTISSAIGGYPIGARLWYTDSAGVSCIVRSTIQNNTNNFLLDDSVIGEAASGKPWEVENFRGIKSQYDLFDKKWTDYELTDMNWLRADTFSWQDGTVYSDAYNHLVDDIEGKTATTETVNGTTVTYYLADDGHKIVKVADVSAVETVYSSTGVAWYYILDTTNQRFKLPRTKYGFTGLRDTVGKYVPETLPNHQHFVEQRQQYSAGSQNNALFYPGEGETSTDIGKANNPVYQDGAPVQQRATQMYLYFYVGQFSQTATEQTAGLNSELFNGKLDLDLGNITNTSKETIVGWGIPDYTAGVTISSPYTATEPCFVSLVGHTQASSGNIVVSINGVSVSKFENGDSHTQCFSSWFYLATGDTITYSSTRGFDLQLVFPLKGVQNA